MDLSDDGKYLRVRVTATNDGGATAAYSTSLGPVDILAPTSSAVPEISGTAEIGSTLTASSGTWDFATDLGGWHGVGGRVGCGCLDERLHGRGGRRGPVSAGARDGLESGR